MPHASVPTRPISTGPISGIPVLGIVPDDEPVALLETPRQKVTRSERVPCARETIERLRVLARQRDEAEPATLRGSEIVSARAR
jgi:hypothetical protein